jgi:hypothetical protein
VVGVAEAAFARLGRKPDQRSDKMALSRARLYRAGRQQSFTPNAAEELLK